MTQHTSLRCGRCPEVTMSRGQSAMEAAAALLPAFWSLLLAMLRGTVASTVRQNLTVSRVAREGGGGRGLHSSTVQLNLSALYGIGVAHRGNVARVEGVLGGVEGVEGGCLCQTWLKLS